jgi:hypothetical protein
MWGGVLGGRGCPSDVGEGRSLGPPLLWSMLGELLGVSDRGFDRGIVDLEMVEGKCERI